MTNSGIQNPKSELQNDADFALTRHLPGLNVPHVSLGQYPTPIEPMPGLGNVWLKREDLSSPVYGGNKLRTLETLLADALDRGVRDVWTLGAYGSNQGVAHVLHARRLGLNAGAVLFPQRATPTAADNLRVTVSKAKRLRLLRSIGSFPLHWLKHHRAAARGREYLVPPGGAIPLGALGHVAAALELAEQIRAGAMPAPAHIVLAIGSTCTTAGLLVGLPLAKRLGLWEGNLPQVHAVRVTPWPVTARSQVLRLARATGRHLTRVGGPSVAPEPALLTLNVKHFGWGYARVTGPALAAERHFREVAAPPLDTTYSGKSGAALLELKDELKGPILFWCTKSSAPLPAADDQKLAHVPGYVKRWLRACLETQSERISERGASNARRPTSA